MKNGVTIRLDRPVTQAAELAARAEDLGFDAVWLADHYFHRDAVAALALMATRTKSVTLGTAVVSPYLRHPALLASSTATLAEISGDRFVLGIGAGGYEFTTQLQVPMPRPLGATREAMQIIRELLAGRADVTGQAFSATGAQLRWAPRPAPIYLAARGPKMLQLAGSVADGVITHGLSAAHLRYVMDQLSAGARRSQAWSGEGVAGGDGNGSSVFGDGAAGDGAGSAGSTQTAGSGRPALCVMLDAQLDDDRAAAVEALRPRCVTMAGGSYADELIGVYGLDPAEVGALRAAVRAGDTAGARTLVTDAMVDAFGIAGSAGYVADRLAELAESGADEVIISLDAGDTDSCTAQLTHLAKAVVS